LPLLFLFGIIGRSNIFDIEASGIKRLEASIPGSKPTRGITKEVTGYLETAFDPHNPPLFYLCFSSVRPGESGQAYSRHRRGLEKFSS
jgi:hypothetical protein